MVLQELWILTQDGEEILHHTFESELTANKDLLTNFLTGLQQFTIQMGGGLFFQIENEDCLITGKKLHIVNPSQMYIIGKFKRIKRLTSKKCQSFLNTIESQMQNRKISISDRENLSKNIHDLLKKMKT